MSDPESPEKLSIISFYQYERDAVSALVRISRENSTQRVVRTELSLSEKFPKWILDPISLSGSDASRLVFEITTGGMIGNTLGKTKLKLSDNTECGSYLLPVSDTGTSGWPIYAGKDQALPAPLQKWVQNRDAISKTDGPKFPKFKLDETGSPRIQKWWMDLQQNVDKELDEVRKTLKEPTIGEVSELKKMRRQIDAMSNLGEQKRVSSTTSSNTGRKLSSLVSTMSRKRSTTEQATGGEATSGEGASSPAKNAVGKTNKQQVADTSDKIEMAKVEERLKGLKDVKSTLKEAKRPNTTTSLKDKLETIEVLVEKMVIETKALKKAAELEQSAAAKTSTTTTTKAIGPEMLNEMLNEIDVTDARKRLDEAKEQREAITMAAVVLILEDKEVKAKMAEKTGKRSIDVPQNDKEVKAKNLKKHPIDVLQNDLWSEGLTGFLHVMLTSSKSK